MSAHQHERWQLRPNSRDGVYCAACGDTVDAPLTYGVREKSSNGGSVVAVHSSKESAEETVTNHPDWFEVVCTAYPSDPKKVWYEA